LGKRKRDLHARETGDGGVDMMTFGSGISGKDEETKPTPRPWYKERCEGNSIIIRGPEDIFICDVWADTEEAKANAELIVSAVNQSDHVKILVEALEEIKKFPVESSDFHEYCELKGVNKIATSALSDYRRATEGK
jgi:hypothetical protein